MTRKLVIMLGIVGLFTLIPSELLAQQEVVKTELEWGKVENGVKVGIWQYYDEPGELALRVNYTTGAILYMKEDPREYSVQLDTAWKRLVPDSPPRFIGSMWELRKMFAENLVYPEDARYNDVEGVAVVSFVVDANGELTKIELESDPGGGCGDELLRLASFIPNTWIPASLNGRTVDSKFTIMGRFVLGEPKPLTAAQRLEYPLLIDKSPSVWNYIISAPRLEIGKGK